MTLKALRKLVDLASEQRGGWESYRAREKAQAELLHYMPKLVRIAELAQGYLKGANGTDDNALAELLDLLAKLEAK